MTSDLPRDLDWFMITKDDYDISTAWTPQADESKEEERMPTLPLGLLEIAALVGVATLYRKRERVAIIFEPDDDES